MKLLLALSCFLAVVNAFSPPSAALGRRQAIAQGAGFLAAVAGAGAANAEFVGEFRKADQSKIGVSDVKIPSKWTSNTVGDKRDTGKLDVSGWTSRTSTLSKTIAEAPKDSLAPKRNKFGRESCSTTKILAGCE